MDTIKIQIDTNAEAASKSFEDLSKSFNDTDKSSQDLRKQIKSLKDELYKLTPGTEEYSKVLQDLGGKMNQLSDTTQELKAASGGLDTVFQSTTNATATMAAGFTAASGVIALFGGKNEDLQKTFVKLQAAMSIMNGLKGFASFGKATKQASVSLKAYISQMNLARTATVKQTTATATLATTEDTAAVATTGLGRAFKALTTAIASNPIGVLLITLGSLFLVIQNVSSRMKEVSKAQDEWNEVTGKGEHASKSYVEQLKEEEAQLERTYTRMKAAGISQEAIAEQQIEDYKKLKEATEANMKAIEDLNNELKSRSGWDRYWNGPEITKQINANTEAWKNLDAELKNINNTLNGLLDNKMPEVVKNLNTTLSNLSNEFRVKIAGGLATQGDYLKAQIKVYQDAQNKLWETVGSGSHKHSQIKGANEEERKANKALSVSFSASLAALQVELDAYNAGIEKKNRDAAQNLADQLKKNYNELINDVADEAKDIVKKWNNILGSLDFNTFTLLPREERSGRLSAQVLRFESEINNYLETWSNLAQKAKNEGKITETQFNDFTASLDKVKTELESSLEIKFDTNNISEEIRNIGESIQNSISKIKLDNENMIKALKAGLISKQEYQEWVVAAMQEYKTITEQAVETNNPFEEAFIQASKAIIPPEVEAQMQSEVKAYYDNIVKEIDKGFEKLVNEYEKESDKLAHKVKMETTAWMHGKDGNLKSGAGLVMTLLFGPNDSPTKAYKRAREEAKNILDAVQDETYKEVQYLKDKMALLDESSEAYQNYEKKIEEIYAKLAIAQEDFENSQLDAAADYADRLYVLTNSTLGSIADLTSALGEYYHEQAEAAKDANDNMTEESKKWLKKEGEMKIASVWTNFAQGVMTAWATSEAFGPIAGPILAAIQTAALLATAITSTQMINRQTKAAMNGSGNSGSSANVSGITDRVIMADAQNTDQTARLNAEYNSGNQKVYVTQNDLDNEHEKRKVAVTQNNF